MATIRSAVLSGTWYPGDQARLGATVDGFLAAADPAARPAGRPLIAVVPHAGYAYSGATAGKLYGLLRGLTYDTVVILAPSHRAALDAIALPSAAAFATPLGTIPVATARVAELAASDPFVIDDHAHAAEHAVEIQLPFLQRTLTPGFAIVPALVPPLPAEHCRAAADRLAPLRRAGALVVVSTDLTHYGANYGYVPFDDDIPDRLEQLDSGAILRLLAHDADALLAYGRETGITMCGLHAAAVALSGDPPPGYEAALIDYSRSGDRDGDYSLSVSYAGVLLTAGPDSAAPDRLSDAERRFLLELARGAVTAAVHDRPAPAATAVADACGVTLGGRLTEPRGAFVTLTREGALRGCIGHIEAVQPLFASVTDNARSAALADPRFPPVGPAELDRIAIEVSALTPLRPVAAADQIVIGRHGIVLAKGGAKAVFLPQVAPEQGWDLATTLSHLAQKAGLPADGWREGAQFSVFEAETMHEQEI
jgi:AmmeMemoRadiSam system protein B/AmmeMemoRadiSam system protein A